MFKIVDTASISDYYYGHVDVKLAICRLIAEILPRMPFENCLDETI